MQKNSFASAITSAINMKSLAGMRRVAILWCGVLATIIGCAARRESYSTPKFMASSQDRRYAWSASSRAIGLLIQKIHQEKILYHVEMDQSGTCVAHADLDRMVFRSIESWIDVVRKSAQDGKLKLMSNTDGTPATLAKATSTPNKNEANLQVILYCEKGQSVTERTTDEKVPILIKLRLSDKNFGEETAGKGPFLNYSTVLHEMGHAFGLADTYPMETKILENYGRYAIQHNPVDIHDAKVLAGQPRSVMNYHFQIFAPNEDDRAAVQWLYGFNVTHVIPSIFSCPEAYRFDPPTGGCIPAPNQSETEKVSSCWAKKGLWKNHGCYCPQAKRYFAPEESVCDRTLPYSWDILDRKLACSVGAKTVRVFGIELEQDISSFRFSILGGGEQSQSFDLDQDLKGSLVASMDANGEVPTELWLRILQRASRPGGNGKMDIANCHIFGAKMP